LVNEEVPVWWWPFTALGAGIPLIAVLGVVGYHELGNVPSPEISPENMYRAWLLKEELERRGFVSRIWEHPEEGRVAVDFYDPTLERRLIELGSYLDAEKMEYLITHLGRGSISFQDNIAEGDIPVITLRPREFHGWWREILSPPPGMIISEVHLHTWDNVASTHIHVWGRNLTVRDIQRLAGFISEAKKATEMFATPVRR